MQLNMDVQAHSLGPTASGSQTEPEFCCSIAMQWATVLSLTVSTCTDCTDYGVLFFQTFAESAAHGLG